MVYLVGQLKAGDAWEVQGIFTTEPAAVAACRGRNDFVMEVPLDTELPRETTPAPVVYYPILGLG